MMEPGWLLLLLFLFVEAFLVLLLVMPMPNNKVRGAITTGIASLWDVQGVRVAFYGFLAFDIFYFWYVFDALVHPLYDFGLLTPGEIFPCEVRAVMYVNERNAYITGFSLFLFLVLNRLLDIQSKLHESRDQVKAGSMGVPMGQPVAQAAPLAGKRHFD
jgi:B-cell receptor-associated protein 31